MFNITTGADLLFNIVNYFYLLQCLHPTHVETFTETNISDWTFVPSAADKNANAITYLASTDWYASRLAENGTAIPADVLEKREAARAAIVD